MEIITCIPNSSPHKRPYIILQHRPRRPRYELLIPQPGLFVLDRERRVTGKHFVRGYRDRPDLERLLDSLR